MKKVLSLCLITAILFAVIPAESISAASCSHEYSSQCDTSCNLCGAFRTTSDGEVVLLAGNYTILRGNQITLTYPSMMKLYLYIPGNSLGGWLTALSAAGYMYSARADLSGWGDNVITVELGYSDSFSVIATSNLSVKVITALCSSKHKYTEETIRATCGTEGAHIYTCTICGDSYMEAIPATGAHTYSYTCSTTCNVCGYVRTVNNHTYRYVVTTKPTCGTEGVATYTCATCGDSYMEAIPATGAHTYSYSCDTTCNVCGYVRTVNNHTYRSVVTIEPTCGTEGVLTYTCSICGDSYTASIPPVGDHSYDNLYDPDCNVCGGIREVPNYIPGDVNGDGKVNVRDLGLFQQYLNGWPVDIILDVCDVNGDDKVNVRDLGLFQQFLNGWDVEIV